MIFAFITCTRVKWEQDEDGMPVGDYIEEHGWIDRGWSPFELYENRNDVSPAFSLDEDDPELMDEVRGTLGWLEGGYEDNGGGTFYASESYQPFDQEWSYSYAVHFKRKFFGPDGWTEEAWVPPLGEQS